MRWGQYETGSRACPSTILVDRFLLGVLAVGMGNHRRHGAARHGTNMDMDMISSIPVVDHSRFPSHASHASRAEDDRFSHLNMHSRL